MKARHEFGEPEQWYDYLRTYFAGQALTQLVGLTYDPEYTAERAILYAEALLTELKK
jgi:hypothetical protein